MRHGVTYVRNFDPENFGSACPPDEIAFNQELAMNLVCLYGDAVLHFKDTHTNFWTATYVTDKSADGLWKLFINCWTNIFPGFPEVLRIDRESSFNSIQLCELTKFKELKLQFSGIEVQNALGKERDITHH